MGNRSTPAWQADCDLRTEAPLPGLYLRRNVITSFRQSNNVSVQYEIPSSAASIAAASRPALFSPGAFLAQPTMDSGLNRCYRWAVCKVDLIARFSRENLPMSAYVKSLLFFVILAFAMTPVATAQTATAEKKEEASAGKKEDAKKEEDKEADKKKSDDKKAEEKEEEEKKVEVRLITPSGNYVDLVAPMSIDPTTLLLGAPAKQKSFYRFCEYLEELEEEEELKQVVFDLSGSLSMNSAQLDELARRMKKLNDSGKETIAWLESASNTQIAFAAACDHVIMADFGGVDMPSVAMQSMFYKDAMDLVGVKASVVRAGDFKGAVEPYLNPRMSNHLREHYLNMLETMNAARVSRIAKGRGLTSSKVRELQKKAMLLPKDALAAGLVDQLAPFGTMKETIEEKIGEKIEWTTPKTKAKRQMSMFELMGRIMSGPTPTTSRVRDNTVAVLHLSGAIVDGKSSSGGSIVSGPTVKEINKLRNDDKVKAVVVRINSPGGSATASEAVRQGLVQLAKEKPTIVSMGDMAASGGYWISCIDVPIYAEEGTLTGSIGVFSLKLSFGSLMRRVGVHVESIALDDVANAFSIDRAWTEGDKELFQETIDHVYDRFLKLVAGARGKSIDDVRPLAGGRVWSGTQAKANGLVDEIGGLDDCLAVVAKKAKLNNEYNVIHRPLASGGLNLLDLIGESDNDEIEANRAFVKLVLTALRKNGFSLQTTSTLVRDALRNSGRPTVWLLNEAELRIR